MLRAREPATKTKERERGADGNLARDDVRGLLRQGRVMKASR